MPEMGQSERPTIDDLKALQRDLNLLDVHVVWLGLGGFVIAHTDEERAEAAMTGLEECEMHIWLVERDGPPARTGYYVVTPHEVDQDSEPYPVARFDFTPLAVL